MGFGSACTGLLEWRSRHGPGEDLPCVGALNNSWGSTAVGAMVGSPLEVECELRGTESRI